MNKKIFYSCIILLISAIFFCGCTGETSTDNSQSDKRALEETSSPNTKTSSETTAETLTPLQTFSSITNTEKKTEKNVTSKNTETKSKKEKSDVKVEYAETESNWFSENKLFDMELIEEETDIFIKTRYRFSDDNNQTTKTTVSITESNIETQKITEKTTEKEKSTNKTKISESKTEKN